MPLIIDLYPASAHVKSLGLLQTSDTLIWSFAQQHGYTIVSKDADLYQRSLVLGTRLLRSSFVLLAAFDADARSSVLFLSLPRSQL